MACFNAGEVTESVRYHEFDIHCDAECGFEKLLIDRGEVGVCLRSGGNFHYDDEMVAPGVVALGSAKEFASKLRSHGQQDSKSHVV